MSEQDFSVEATDEQGAQAPAEADQDVSPNAGDDDAANEDFDGAAKDEL